METGASWRHAAAAAMAPGLQVGELRDLHCSVGNCWAWYLRVWIVNCSRIRQFSCNVVWLCCPCLNAMLGGSVFIIRA